MFACEVMEEWWRGCGVCFVICMYSRAWKLVNVVGLLDLFVKDCGKVGSVVGKDVEGGRYTVMLSFISRNVIFCRTSPGCIYQVTLVTLRKPRH